MSRVEWRLAKLEEVHQQKAEADRIRNLVHQPRVKRAVADPYTWATQHTKTYNEHWVEEGRPSAYEPFPQHQYLAYVFAGIDLNRIIWFEKSRDMMLSWACVAYLTLHAMKVPRRGVILQTQNSEKVKQLVKYAKTLYENQPSWLKDAFPLSKPMRLQPELSLEFAHGGKIVGIPGGANQIRSYHPWGYLLDEASFVPDAGECYAAALSVAKGKIILNSSAGPGWYADARRDIVRN